MKNNSDGTYRGFEYRFEKERDGDGFTRYTTLIFINGIWKDAVPCHLDTNGPSWAKEMDSFIDKL